MCGVPGQEQDPGQPFYRQKRRDLSAPCSTRQTPGLARVDTHGLSFRITHGCMSSRPRFHLAIGVDDLARARAFYGQILGCAEGRSSARWVDFNLYGHQLTVHLRLEEGAESRHAVDGDSVPVPHFGLILPWEDWHALVERLNSAGVEYVIPPRIRFQGLPGEQATLFLRDPSQNALEFKSFRDDASVFAREP